MTTDSALMRSSAPPRSIHRPTQVESHHTRGPPRLAFAGLALAGLVLSTAAFWVALTGAGSQPRALAATTHALVIAAPIAAGLYALRTQPSPADRFGWVLVIAGLVWSPTLLAESADSLAYSVGRVAAWVAEASLVYVVLAYPSGRLVSRADRLLAGLAFAVVGVLFLPTILLVDQFPLPSPWSSCGSDCPPNAFMAIASEPGFVDAFVLPLAWSLSFAVYAGAAFVLARRLAGSSRLARAGLMVVLVVAIVRMVAAAAFLVARRRSPESELTDFLGLAALLCVPAFSAAFVAGLLRSRWAARRAMARLGAGLGIRPDPAQLRDAIAEAVDDPSLEILYWNTEDPGGWVDAHGEPVVLPRLSSERRLTEVQGSGGRVAVLVHDAALEHAPVVTQVARGFARMALENQRLETQLRSSLRELQASRTRILSAADRERRRIERDLHDGAQQRLVGLGIQLELAGDQVRTDPIKAAARLRELARDVDDAVDEVRSLARGLVPPLLVERGLVDALRDVAASGPLMTTVQARRLGRYGPEIESAVYFCCREALQNASKHASGARSVSVTLWEDDELRFEVQDDGEGLPDRPDQRGSGLTNMRDRMGAVGGRLTIESAHGEGTRVAGAAPLALPDVSTQGEALLRRATDALEDCFAICRAVRREHEATDFLVEHVNAAACADAGLDRDELVGRYVGDLYTGLLASAQLRWLRQVLDRGERDSKVAVEHGRTFEVRAAPLGGGRVVVTWRDVTTRRAAPTARSESRSTGRPS